MKKVLSTALIIFLIATVTGGFLVLRRWTQNPLQVFPYPYAFTTEAPGISLDAPILIVGDRMGAYLAKFQTELAETISQDLSKNIRVQSLAKEGNAIHRTLHELKSLAQWPQIVIFQGASEEFREEKFLSTEIPKILTNFHRYNDDRLQTLLIFYPAMSRIIYEPHNRVRFTEVPSVTQPYDEKTYLNRLEMENRLFEEQLTQLVIQSRDHGSLLILTTTPVNFDIKPRRVCEFTTTSEIEKGIREIEEMVKNEDFKSAIAKSSKMIEVYPGNANLIFLHGQINAKLGRQNEAKAALLEASAYDCEPWRATEIQNTIIRKVAQNQQVLLFDFSELVSRGWTESPRFFDEIYPQNVVYSEATKQLGLVIKNILKL